MAYDINQHQSHTNIVFKNNRLIIMKGRIDTDKAREFAIKRKGQAIEKAKAGNSQKSPVFIKELNMTVYVLPGADIAAIIKKHKEMKDWRRKTLHD